MAGADKEVLRQCSNSEKVKISGFGTLVLIPAIVGLFSMTYAISTLTNNALLFLAGGIIWFFIVLFIDRFIVSTLYKTKLDDKVNFPLAVIVRYVFAIIVGVAVSHPMVLLWFDDSITEMIILERDNKIIDAEKKFQSSIDSLKVPLNEKIRRRDCLEKLLFAEQSGHKVSLPCGYSSGIPNIRGNFPRTKKIEKKLNDLNAEIRLLNVYVEKRIEDLKKDKDNIKNNIQKFTGFDYLKRVKKLGELEESHISGEHIKAVRWFIMLFIVFVDILPVTMKVVTPYGEYEAIKDQAAHKTIKRKKVEIQAFNAFANSVLFERINNTYKHEQIVNDMIKIRDMFNKFVEEEESQRKIFENKVKDIFRDINVTKDEEIKKEYVNYLIGLREIYREVVNKVRQNLLDYIKSI